MKWIATGQVMLTSAFIFLTGCAHFIVNDQSHHFDPESGYRFDALDPGALNTDTR
jgi:hypothetical protein